MNTRIAAAAAAAALLATAACGQNGAPAPSSSSTEPAAASSAGAWSSSARPGPAPAGALASPAHGYFPSLTATPGTPDGATVSIPTLQGGDPAVTKRFNEAMKASRAGMPPADESTTASDGELTGGYRSGVTRIGANAVAGRIVLYWNGKGAAHPNNSLGTVVIATKTATPVTVDDVYRDKSAALGRIRGLLPELDTSGRLRADNVSGDDILDAWLPTATGIEVYVPVAHVAGDYVPVVVPYVKIADLLRPGMLDVLRAD
ncbi:hypothetical protein [Tsukamurella strandjordii]|uniref:DUF3298 domain-containing protein n=1 Tax=Tsukamurella strandjordii TaxID=147577 RepID=A0AA90NLA9_9ACTN|nr:hypothetical protein [Tsukamurella strandjordii]MDP0399749.1 hypothetical protein [Tsukamurella strandjordii]